MGEKMGPRIREDKRGVRLFCSCVQVSRGGGVVAMGRMARLGRGWLGVLRVTVAW